MNLPMDFNVLKEDRSTFFLKIAHDLIPFVEISLTKCQRAGRFLHYSGSIVIVGVGYKSRDSKGLTDLFSIARFPL